MKVLIDGKEMDVTSIQFSPADNSYTHRSETHTDGARHVEFTFDARPLTPNNIIEIKLQQPVTGISEKVKYNV